MLLRSRRRGRLNHHQVLFAGDQVLRGPHFLPIPAPRHQPHLVRLQHNVRDRKGSVNVALRQWTCCSEIAHWFSGSPHQCLHHSRHLTVAPSNCLKPPFFSIKIMSSMFFSRAFVGWNPS